MNKFKFILFSLAAAVMAACSSNDDEPKEPIIDPVEPVDGCFILNQGTMGLQLEGGLTYVDLSTYKATQNMFQTANNRSLGNTPQCGIIVDEMIIIGVYESNTIEIVNAATMQSIKQISLEKETGKNPRSMVTDGKYVYISMYNGYVSRLNIKTLEIEGSVQVGPNPEKIAIKNVSGKNYIYVPNSDGMNYPNYGTTASVIDTDSFKVTKTLTVGLNPNEFVVSGDDLFLICTGNYYDVPATLYRMDATGNFTAVAEATNVCAGPEGFVYFMNAPWGAKASYYRYEISTGEITSLLGEGEGVDSPVAIYYEPTRGIILIASNSMDGDYPSYSTPGYVRLYDDSGSLIATCATGICPCCIFSQK